MAPTILSQTNLTYFYEKKPKLLFLMLCTKIKDNLPMC
jgi:hypothetical protein